MKALSLSQVSAQAVDTDTLLRMHNAQCWTPAAIAAHKKKELESAPPASNFFWCRTILQVTLFEILPLALLMCLTVTSAFLALSVVGYISLVLAAHIAPLFSLTGASLIIVMEGRMLLFGVYSFLAFLASATALIPLIFTTGKRIYGPAQWNAVPYDEFRQRQYVPDKVKELVSSVQSFKPGAVITVHELVQDSYLLDPILEIDGRFPFVWDAQGHITAPSS